MFTKNIIILLTKSDKRLLNFGILLLRLTLGGILFVAGAGKVLGWFGGFGLTVTLGYYAKSGISTPFAYLSCYTEFIGGFLLAVGLLTRPAAFAVMINMLVAFIVTLPGGFIMGGASYPFSFLISAIIILLSGPLAYSLDYILLKPGELKK
ncbi:MAG: DoxX family protein [Ignavibacteriaceae bacterium]|nr:DoxX family protein [Ignavibacteriaceae bacterium]